MLLVGLQPGVEVSSGNDAAVDAELRPQIAVDAAKAGDEPHDGALARQDLTRPGRRDAAGHAVAVRHNYRHFANQRFAPA